MKILICFFVAIVTLAVTVGPVQAQVPDATVYTVAYVDVMPSGHAAAIAALKAYRGASAGEPGHIRVDVFEQVSRQAHFALVEAWRDQGALDAHAGSAASKQFQDTLRPLRVSGYDQRPYKPLSLAPARPANDSAVHVVSHVDIGGGGGQTTAPAMLRELAETSRSEPGNQRFDVLQHATRGNHFTVVESWVNQAARDRHAAAPHTRQYRDTLQPISGSPLDERVYLAVE